MSNNKLIYTYQHGDQAISPEMLTTYMGSLIMDPDKRSIYYKGHIYGHAYYGSTYGEVFNDFTYNEASGEYSHAEGYKTKAKGAYSHTGGYGTVTISDNETAIGRYNVTNNGYLFSVGNGVDDDNRQNIMTVTKESTYMNGSTYVDSLYGTVSWGHLE